MQMEVSSGTWLGMCGKDQSSQAAAKRGSRSFAPTLRSPSTDRPTGRHNRNLNAAALAKAALLHGGPAGSDNAMQRRFNMLSAIQGIGEADLAACRARASAC